jgi:hypothetical protein
MSIVNLHKWLRAGQDFDAGVSLAKEFLQGDVSLMAILKHRSSFAERKLQMALEALAELHPLPEEPTKPETVVTDPVKSKKKHYIGKTDGYPDHLVELDKVVLRRIKERDNLRPLLFVTPEGEPLHQIAIKVVELDQLITDNIDELTYFAQTGRLLPGTEPIEGMRKIAHLMLALKNNPSYISKHQNSKNEIVQLEVIRRKGELEEANNFIKQHA